MELKNLLLVDSYGLFYKYYYAFINNPLRTKDGRETSVILSFFNIFLSILLSEKYDAVILAFDSKTKTFRHDLYREYKANRPPMPDSLKQQINTVIKILKKINFPIYQLDGYEADDVIGTITNLTTKKNINSFILSIDKDLNQLIDNNTRIVKPLNTTDFSIISEKEVYEKYSITAEQFIDYLSLIGDASDNIPGAKGIGPKTAVNLLKEYQNIDNILNNIENIKQKALKKKLIDSKENIILSKKLVTINRNIPIDIDLTNLKYTITNKNIQDAVDILSDLELKSIISKLEKLIPKNNKNIKQKSDNVNTDEDLFEYKQSVSNKYKNEFNRKIINYKEIDILEQETKKNKLVFFDIETTSLNPYDSKIIGISFCFKNKNSYYLNLFDYKNKVFLFDKIKKELDKILNNENTSLVGHNLKYEYSVLKLNGIKLKKLYLDTMLTAYVYNSERTHYNLDSLAAEYFNYDKKSYKELLKDKDNNILNVPLEEIADYSLDDVEFTYRLYKLLKSKTDKTMKKILAEIEMPLIKVLSEIELTGVLIDKKYLLKLEKKFDEELNKLIKNIYDSAGEEFNINSTKQLQEILFNKLKIKPVKKTKTGFSTDVGVLQQLSHTEKIAEYLLRYRTLTKLKNTYISSLPKLINKKTNRIHTDYNQAVTATGRLSSSNPNLQNIPIKTKEGRLIRKAFISMPDYYMASFDYSQVEIRILAYMSKDPLLLEAFKNNVDIHKKTAGIIYGIDEKEVTPDQRRIAKTINFSVIYGITPYKLSQDMGISFSDAKQFIETYFDTYRGIKKFIQEKLQEAQENGYTQTFYGRKRIIPKVSSDKKNNFLTKHIDRIAFNTIIQGTASEIIKKAMINIYKQIHKSDEIQMIMQVHDELIFYIKKDKIKYWSDIIINTMETASPFKEKLKVDYKIGNYWGDQSVKL